MTNPPPNEPNRHDTDRPRGMWSAIIGFCLENRLVVLIVVLLAVTAGIVTAPFDWRIGWLPRHPVPVDAIPDIGENQQIVFTAWPGMSPRDVEDQITYPLTSSLMGITGVRTVRSTSMFGFSSIYVIFEEDIGFNEARNLLLTRLNSLPIDLPEGVQPRLGPEATALGQIFWYTLEGRNARGEPAPGYDLQELRTIQDWYLRYDLLASATADGAKPIAEVGSVGGYVREYQVDVDPDAMRAFDVTLDEVVRAVRSSNRDVGARTIEINRVEYFIRGLGFLTSVDDLRHTVVAVHENTPVTVDHVAHVQMGPALRRGALDKAGAEAVGGVAVVRYGENPLAAIRAVKTRLDEIGRRVETADGPVWLLDAHTQMGPEGEAVYPAVVPFYDRTGLIYETLGTLYTALSQQILVTVIVVVVMVFHLRSSVLIAGLLPLAVLLTFVAMKGAGVDANIVALTGIAIAIGTMVDMGIVICENILKHLEEAPPDASSRAVIRRAASEVSGAVMTAAATTIVGFLPVFFMTGAEGKLFRPLAFTKTFALAAAAIIALVVIPPAASVLLTGRARRGGLRWVWGGLLVAAGVVLWLFVAWWAGAVAGALGAALIVERLLPERYRGWAPWIVNGLVVLFVGALLASDWMPLGVRRGLAANLLFVGVVVGGLLVLYRLFQWAYPWVLGWCLDHKILFLCIPAAMVLLALAVWLGPGIVFGPVEDVFGPAADRLAGRSWEGPGGVADASFDTKVRWTLYRSWGGLGRQFMPPLDEGSFLWMPTTSPHASIGEALDVVAKQDRAFMAIPEVETAVGKIGRVDSPLDPAPISMIETVIQYKPEFVTDRDGRRLRFRYDERAGEFVRDDRGELIPDDDGRPFRQWRDRIESPDDIWDEIVRAGDVPGATSAPKLQPIKARLVMLQTGMRAPMGMKVFGPNLEDIEAASISLEQALLELPEIGYAQAERIVAKPYIVFDLREADSAATRRRYGISVERVQQVIETAIGGRPITTTVEGRKRFPVRVRYLRELRDRLDSLQRILVPAPDGTQVPLEQVASMRIEPGPQSIKSEDTYKVNYVIFDMAEGLSEVEVVEAARAHLLAERKAGRLVLPKGVYYEFAGEYENQLRARRTLMVVLPVSLVTIFLLLYLQFRRVGSTLMVFTGILVAWSGGFVLVWLYGQPWFMDVDLFGANLRELFGVRTVYLSVAVWVGFLALFGIATDDGVVMTTYLDQSMARRKPRNKAELREAVMVAGRRRVRPCLMTTATTVIALLPVLTATGRGSDIMVPMAIPVFGGMLIEVLTMLVVPVLYMSAGGRVRR